MTHNDEADGDNADQVIPAVLNAVEYVDGFKGLVSCPLCDGELRVSFEKYDERRGAVYYECVNCHEIGHLTVRVPPTA